MTMRAVFAACMVWAIAAGQNAAAGQHDAAGRDVWLINTHGVCGDCSAALESQSVGIWRLAGDCQWVASDLRSLWATDDPAAPTVIFVHGNNSSPDDAIQMAWPVYEQLCGDPSGHPFRLVIWAWPAERMVRGIRADLQLKACRSDTESVLVGQFVDRVQPQVPVTFIGYSFGARIIGGALELLAGGQLNGCCLPHKNVAPRVPMRAMLVAAAMDADWLLPGHRDGEALAQVDQLYLTVNGSDRVLRWYRLLYGAGGPEALGCAGPACCACLGPEQAKLDMADVTCAVGREHDWDHYLACSGICGKLGWYAFRQQPVGAADAAPPKEKPAAAKVQSSKNNKAVAKN
jgi:hypothetical protein